ncbi:LysR family transcriptional regulator [Vibrio sp. MA40-2]|uniref:LysR family transcriptional regulator n=1 Tax=Vibrio sp. MA40-2 TaxID=3391828 RepID=UPI0039A44075
MLNIWRLKLLVQFQTLGTMQRVSEVMHTSIATVSQQLSLLEQETNTILFEKVGRKVQLTHEGHALVEKTRPILNQLNDIEQSLKDNLAEVQGTVRIAAFTSALEKIVIPAVSLLSQHYPKLQMRLTEMDPDTSLPALDTYQLDVAVVAYSKKQHLLEQSHRNVIKLGSDRLKALVSNKHPLAKKTRITIDELKDESWVLEPEGTYLYEYTQELCRNAGFEPNIINVVQSYLPMHTMIAANIGIGILPELAIIESVEGICVLDLEPDPTRDIYLVVRNNTTTTRAMNAVTESLINNKNPLTY